MPTYYHSTTDDGLEALTSGSPIRSGTFLSLIKDGSQQLPKRPHRLTIQIDDESHIQLYWDWIHSVGRDTTFPGKFWNDWRVTTSPIIEYTIIEIEDDPWG